MVVTYWRDGRAVGVEGLWIGMPVEDVLWVDIGNHRMQGMDNYWVHGNYYGAFNDSENRDVYEGFMQSRWRIEPFEKASRTLPPKNAYVIRGVTIPDEDAVRLGLI